MKRSPASRSLLLLALFTITGAIFAASPCASQDGPATPSPYALIDADEEFTQLTLAWRTRTGDDPAWADPAFDDSAWNLAELDDDASPPVDDVVWYRRKIRREDATSPRALGLLVRQQGASEIYFDGELLARYGRVSADPAEEEPLWPLETLYLPLHDTREHLLAVRYSNVSRIAPVGQERPGVRLYVVDFADRFRQTYARRAATDWGAPWVASGLVFALLNLCFYFFRREDLTFLGLAAASAGYAGLLGFAGYGSYISDPQRWLLLEKLHMTSGIVMLTAFGCLGYLFSERFLPLIRILLVVAAACLIWAWTTGNPWAFSLLAILVVGLTGPFISAGVRHHRSLLLGIGFTAVAVAGGLQTLGGIGVIEIGLVLPYGMTVLLLTASLHLARNFADAQVAAAEHERKTHELEEARNLQLALLPKTTPQHPSWEFVWTMRTATEVGGDFYDFVEDEDGVTLAIGDAGGHGLRAGMLAMSTKSLFRAAASSDVEQTMRQIAVGVEGMNLVRQHMALFVARLEDGSLTWSSAGMPGPLVYRAASGEVEEIVLPAPPLGAFAGVRREIARVDLQPGDLVLLMSDGLPEAPGRQTQGIGDQLGDAAVRERFAELAPQGPQAVLGGLLLLMESWTDEETPDDDVSLIVLRYDI